MAVYSFCLVGLLVVFSQLSALVAVPVAANSGPGKLHVHSLSKRQLAAMFQDGSDPEIGVHITSRVTGKGSFLNITSFGGREVLFSRHSDPISSALLRIMGHPLFIRRQRPLTSPWAMPMADPMFDEENIFPPRHALMDFALPFEVSNLFDMGIQRHSIPSEFEFHLDMDGANTTKEAAFSKLFQSPELRSAIDACFALGDEGIFGHENPPAMKLFGLMHRLQKLMLSDFGLNLIPPTTLVSTSSPSSQETNPFPTESDQNSALPTASVATHEDQLSTLPATEIGISQRVFSGKTIYKSSSNNLASDIAKVREERVRKSPQLCPQLKPLRDRDPDFPNRYTCERCPLEGDCLGMCGPGCSSCWWFVCGGDCCFHQGCYEHDQCCREKGYDYPGCYFPLEGFSCDSYSTC